MELSEIIPHIEVLIFASEKPLTAIEIVELINNAFGFLEERVSLDQVESCIEGIKEKYSSEFYPFEIKESGGGLQFLTKHEYHKTIAQLNGDKFLKRLSSAALESLAIIAYKQPITKGEIEKIRGVNSDYSVQKLLEKELIVIAGRDEKAPGHPLIYTTSKTFMDYFGINTTADLPKIREVLAEQLVEGTLISELDFQTNISSLPKEDEEVEVDIDEVSVEISVLDSADEDEMETEAITEEMLAQLTEEDSVDTSASSDDESKLSEKTDEVKNDE
ncbi:MAG: SMC-Scp complex subunit ScpB [Chitinophagaceae bacterium]|nr:SMC-Scp complex subunit ScpB [Chitinophagaceae bacterium]